jgi:BioD-like phosphotransacetylase family protein
LVHKPLSFDSNDSDKDLELISSINGQEQKLAPTRTISSGDLSPQIAATIRAEINTLAQNEGTIIIHGLPIVTTQGDSIISAQLAHSLGAPVIGVISDYAESLDLIKEAQKKEFGSLLSGIIINAKTKYKPNDDKSSSPATQILNQIPVLGVIPEDRLLLAPTVRQLVEHLGGTTVLNGRGQDQLIEQFLIGGLILEWGGNYFGRFNNQGVITRGGRIDIAMAALNFPLSCLVLTGGTEIPQYVYYRAEEQNVPLIIVEQNTLEVAFQLETLENRVSVHHPDKISRITKLLTECTDWTTLNRVLETQ